jgi:hypothetical protein
VDRASGLFGHELDGPVDIFVYDAREDFFGALGPAAREWTGAAAYPELRTVFMWLQGGPSSYLDTTLVHEVTHVVFYDATRNAFHEPAHWLNEGLAVWSEQQSGETARFTVQSEASRGLFAFEAISAQFPLDDRGARLAYAQGTAMIGMIIDDYGAEAIARIAEAYRHGASDEEALRTGTQLPADQLYARFYSDFGVAEPQPIEPAPIRPSNVRHPGSPAATGEQAEPAASVTPQPAPQTPTIDVGVAVAMILIGAVAAGLVATAFIVRRRNESGGPEAGA